jgi:hypothetical protein
VQRLVVAFVRPEVDAAGLENPDPLQLSREVAAQHVEKTSGERRPHHVEMRGNRILDADRRRAAPLARERASLPTPSSRS